MLDISVLNNQANSIKQTIDLTVQGGEDGQLTDAELTNLQMQMGQYERVYGTISAVIAKVNQTASSIIQKL